MNARSKLAKLLGTMLVLGAGGCGSSSAEHGANDSAMADPDARIATGPAATVAFVVVGAEVDPAVRERFVALLSSALGRPAIGTTAEALPPTLDANSLVLTIGDNAVTRLVIGADERAKLAPEAFVARSGKRGDATVLAADGAPSKNHPHGNLGALHGAYALLEELGFGFLHPLAPVVPVSLRLPGAAVNRTEAPRWDTRAIHYHTQHPLELTELLQGFGESGPDDQAGFEKMLPEWDRFVEWAVANGQNGIEWFLLWSSTWADFADSDVRIQRLAELVRHAHAFGIGAGIDAPIAFQQQHSFRLLRNQGVLADELAEIDRHLDWLARADWDFYGIEAGTSEFTSPDPARMLAWENEVAKHLDEALGGKRAFVKVHCSTGQTAAGFPDPVTGQPINVNMLPHFADARLGVLPHTVQHYGLTDQAPTYGNTTFGYIRDFLWQEAGRRPVVYYPESAYWVSFDIDVPLFLPLYADRRIADLQLLAADEQAKHEKMDGQLFFSSGWEWGYWLNDVLTARAAWDPAPTTEAALERALRVFGGARTDVATWIVDVVAAEQETLIDGKVSGIGPAVIAQRNGQGYLQGWDTWDDVAKLGQSVSLPIVEVQPDKLGLVDMRNPLHAGPGYSKEVEPLLAAMVSRFADLATRGDALRARIPVNAKDLFDDLADAMKMTALRAAQIHGLYDYVDRILDLSSTKRNARLAVARKALDDAAAVVAAREARYRVPLARIAGWRANPTAYDFGYLWTVHALHYWWRDEGKAVDAPLFPCYMNIIDPVDVAVGEGIGTDAARWIGSFLSSDQQRGCLAEPSSEPRYPQDELRTRP